MQTPTSAVHPAAPDDMAVAIAEARASFPRFLAAFACPTPAQSGFHLRIHFDLGDRCEDIWLSDLQGLSSSTAESSGVCASEGRLPEFTFGQRVVFRAAWITDWTYKEDGRTVGAFTTQVLLNRRSKPSRLSSLDSLTKRRPSDSVRNLPSLDRHLRAG